MDPREKRSSEEAHVGLPSWRSRAALAPGGGAELVPARMLRSGVQASSSRLLLAPAEAAAAVQRRRQRSRMPVALAQRRLGARGRRGAARLTVEQRRSRQREPPIRRARGAGEGIWGLEQRSSSRRRAEIESEQGARVNASEPSGANEKGDANRAAEKDRESHGGEKRRK
nr:unnamed protein product [Digitaria exilis]